MADFGVETVWLDLPAIAGAFSRRLYEAGLPCTPERSANFAHAVTLVRPVSRTRLYWTARAVFVSDPAQVRPFDAVFAELFRTIEHSNIETSDNVGESRQAVPAPADARPSVDGGDGQIADDALAAASAASTAARPDDDPAEKEVAVPVAPSDEEVLRGKRFDALEPHELAQLYRLMSRMRIAAPQRRTRRAKRDHHGERIDLRRTLRGSLHTGGDPIRLARRRRQIVRRRIVLLCDISGSMEPYARAYLQFLTCAAGGGARGAEAFVFATRLTRLTRALKSRSPERAIQRAAAAAPDWSSGTRIGDALKQFNDRYGRRGMARGAVVVILSDGWERGDPALVKREMERLGRLAHRIVWVNPRVSARSFSPRTGGMAAALPHCDALVSGHSLEALGQVVDAIGAPHHGDWDPPAPLEADPEDEPWASATPVAGSSVAMPSGYSPSRGIAGAIPGEFAWRRTRGITRD